MKLFFICLFLINIYAANIVFVHGLNSNSNTFYKMASEIAKARGKNKILKLGYEHQILDNHKCYNENDELVDCNKSDFASNNTFKIIYGLKENQFATKNIYYKILSLDEKNLTIPKANILPTNFKANIHTIIINLSNNKNLSFEAQGKELKILLDKIEKITNEKDFILIGHSMGGIAIREYMQKFFDRNLTIDGIITIATPHKGVKTKDILGIFGASGKNLLFNSDEIKNLNSYNLNVYKTIPFIVFKITGYDKNILSGDLIKGSNDDGVVSGDSQIPPALIKSYVISFQPTCNANINCISTKNAIYHTNETSNPFIIDEIKKFVINQIKVNKGWNLVSGKFENFNLKPIYLAWKYKNKNWTFYSNNPDIKEKAKNFKEFNVSNNNEGIWIYSPIKREFLNIEDNSILNYTYNKNWTLAGTNRDVNITLIKCNASFKIIWKYINNTWKVYYKDKKEFNKIRKNRGFWVGCF